MVHIPLIDLTSVEPVNTKSRAGNETESGIHDSPTLSERYFDVSNAVRVVQNSSLYRGRLHHTGQGDSQRQSGVVKRVTEKKAVIPALSGAISKPILQIPGYKIIKSLISSSVLPLMPTTRGTPSSYHGDYKFIIPEAYRQMLSNNRSKQSTDIMILVRVSIINGSTQCLQKIKIRLNNHARTPTSSSKGELHILTWSPKDVLNTIEENKIRITARAREPQKSSQYKVFVGIVRRYSGEVMMAYLQHQNRMSIGSTVRKVCRVLNYTEEGEIHVGVTNFKFSLSCPLGKTLMKIPIRSKRCTHVACFDAFNFFCIFGKSAEWKCPVCNKYMELNELRIDGLFEKILHCLEGKDFKDVSIDENGGFTFVSSNTEFRASMEDLNSSVSFPDKERIL